MKKATTAAKPLKEVRGAFQGDPLDIPYFHCSCGNSQQVEDLLFDPKQPDDVWCPVCRTDAFLLGVSERERNEQSVGKDQSGESKDGSGDVGAASPS